MMLSNKFLNAAHLVGMSLKSEELNLRTINGEGSTRNPNSQLLGSYYLNKVNNT